MALSFQELGACRDLKSDTHLRNKGERLNGMSRSYKMGGWEVIALPSVWISSLLI